jgi:hypothetical protein
MSASGAAAGRTKLKRNRNRRTFVSDSRKSAAGSAALHAAPARTRPRHRHFKQASPRDAGGCRGQASDQSFKDGGFLKIDRQRCWSAGMRLPPVGSRVGGDGPSLDALAATYVKLVLAIDGGDPPSAERTRVSARRLAAGFAEFRPEVTPPRAAPTRFRADLRERRSRMPRRRADQTPSQIP